MSENLHVSPKPFSDLSCPSCKNPLSAKLLVCDSCQVRVEGDFQPNEFASLPAEDLHFLRVFVQAEGRIRDMESALGLSYPTIRTRLSALKAKLARDAAADRDDLVQIALAELASGAATFEETLAKIHKIKKSS